MNEDRCCWCNKTGHLSEDCPDYKPQGPRALIAGLLLGLLAGCTTAPAKPEPITITLTEAQAQLCNDQGGCALLTRRGVAVLQQQAHALGADQGYTAGQKTCREKSL